MKRKQSWMYLITKVIERRADFSSDEFLETNFCNYLKGQDSNTGKGRILLRETWEYRFSQVYR